MAHFYRIKNWSEFQHYRDRNPTWIKLHKRLLDDYEFQSLPVGSRALAPMLWLMASEYSDPSEGRIDGDLQKISFRLRLSEEEIKKYISPLIIKGFIEVVDASTGELIANPEQVDRPENIEQKIEKRRKKETEADYVRDQHFMTFISIFPKQRADTKAVAYRAWLKAIKLATPEVIIDAATRYADSDEVARGYAKGTAAWLNGCRWTHDYTRKPARHQHQNKGPSYCDQVGAAAQLAIRAIESEMVGEDPQADTEEL